MKLQYEIQEASAGCYVYMIMEDNGNRLFYIKTSTYKSKEFVDALMKNPEIFLVDAIQKLSPGKELKTKAIEDLLQ